MATAQKIALRETRAAAVDPATIDQRVAIRGTWGTYEKLLADRGDAPQPRIAFFGGTIELTAPSNEHEVDKERFGRLLEAWAEEVGIDIDAHGSWTIKRRKDEIGVEPDKCYVLLARHHAPPAMPDIAIEVVRTSGGIDKLEIYGRLKVPEVWFWKKSELSFHILTDGKYVRAERSALFPGLDPTLLVRFMKTGTQLQAIRAIREALRSNPRKKARRR